MNRRRPHPIELESYRIMRSRADFDHFPPLSRAVVERVVHTTADPSWVGEVVAEEESLIAGRQALLDGATLVTDVRMVAAGITARDAVVGLELPGVSDLGRRAGLTRSAAGVRAAAERVPNGAIWAVGNAPTALEELIRLSEEGTARPALIVGVPVGFVGAVESRAKLRRSGLPSVTTLSERGGAAIASAAVNALLYYEETEESGGGP